MDKHKLLIKDFLERSEQPIDVETIRKNIKISHWSACLSNLLELIIEGKISGQKTSKGWVFWAKEADET